MSLKSKVTFMVTNKTSWEMFDTDIFFVDDIGFAGIEIEGSLESNSP